MKKLLPKEIKVILLFRLLLREAQDTPPLSLEREEISELCWCQNDQILNVVSDFQSKKIKKMKKKKILKQNLNKKSEKLGGKVR